LRLRRNVFDHKVRSLGIFGIIELSNYQGQLLKRGYYRLASLFLFGQSIA